MALDWELTPFAELTPDTLYDLLQLRSLVFVVEQTCVFLDLDGKKDREALHLVGRDAERRVVAYARLLAAGIAYDEPSIGRVVSHPDVRRSGAGRELMAEAIRRCAERFGNVPLRIGAQRYLERFYGSFGFIPDGEPYDEDGIPHVHMVRRSG